MRTTNRLIATATAVVAIGAVLAGCTSPVTPDVRFPAEKLTISLRTMVVGQEVSATLPEAMGGKDGLVYSLSPDVPGLTFDPATRVLSGTPTTPGTYDMTYTATDSATGGTMESVKFTIAVEPVVLMPTTEESLMGAVWVHEDGWQNDDGAQGTRRYMLVFTKDRWIAHFAHVRTDGTFDEEESHTQSGTWTATDTEITRTWYDDDMLRNLPKAYSWGNDERTALYLKIWERENDLEDVDYWLYTREPLDTDITGTWFDEDWVDHDDGRREHRTWTLEITGSTMAYTTTTQIDDAEVNVIVQEGPIEHDADGLFLWHSVTSLLENGEPKHDPGLVGQRLRWGYLPVGDALIISPYWAEQRYDGEAVTDNSDRPFGGYWHRFIKQ